ncbi:hypothetical protein B5M47_02685 [candidate division CPR3 bacterium 4484_211]|uniref:DNA mismatch repair protein MutL n=1 Tax=candidate division CPR3 bacterium 4484_211 TaxID=1968527 RepID=A0A1W9NXV4_UNCC3|nr:MAG: hypothetical protein B5M47_02685 [candidate division CPR3 bacterium 4484_211]
MGKIKILSPQLIDQIAAGEVVERPASVVKELVENSLDAKATFVEIEVIQGGREKIAVRDNGEGMSKEDARLCLRRHATSKVSCLEDLVSIKTFGFRGEALSSIAAVSKLVLKTNRKGQFEGTEVAVEGGKEKFVRACAHPPGTTVEVLDLFYNIPARQKFLKSAVTEFNRVKDVVVGQALSSPGAGFLLKHNRKEVFNLPPQSWEERVQSVLGVDLENFIKVEGQTPYVKLVGLVGLPQTARKKRPNQFLFVNHRRILQNKTIWGALKEAFRNVLPAHLHLPYILSLQIREDLIDVNVHPRKEEVEFVSPNMVYNLLLSSLRSSLSRHLEKSSGRQNYSVASPGEIGGMVKEAIPGAAAAARAEFVTREDWTRQYHQVDFIKEALDFGTKEGRAGGLFQLAKLYIVDIQPEQLVVYDQHAAEERVLLEDFILAFKKGQEAGLGQELLFPTEIDFSAGDVGILKQNRQALEKIGFRLEFTGGNHVRVEAVPVSLKGRNLRQILLGFVDDLSSGKAGIDLDFSFGIDAESLKALTFLACRTAIKQGDVLGQDQMRRLVEKVESLGERGLTCPHGRPTRIVISLKQLAKMFKRI